MLNEASSACRREAQKADRNAREQVVTNVIRRFLTDDRGATAIEYALLASLISVAVIAAMQVTATSLNNVFSEVSTALK